MRFLLDTDTASLYMRYQLPNLPLIDHLIEAGEAVISACTRGELLFGRSMPQCGKATRDNIDLFIRSTKALPWDAASADVYGALLAQLTTSGRLIGHMDTMIASHALSQKLTLVTNNFRHFSRVPGLPLQNWLSHEPV